jgi:hypothetical protein
MGKLSRTKGAAFERRCKAIMAQATGHPHWKRSPGGEFQWFGDLIPCHEDGEPTTLDSGALYVECKVTAILQKGKMEEWLSKIKSESKGKDWFLLFAQDRGPVYVYSNTSVVDDEFMGPCYVTFMRS